MPKLAENTLPTYRLHTATGQAVVRLPGGTSHYLGKFGSPPSRQKYDAIIAEWIAAGRPTGGIRRPAELTVVDLVLRYDDHAKAYYGEANPKRGEIGGIRMALRIVRKLYGRMPAAEFGPLCMIAVREQFVAAGWSRKFINHQVNRVRRMFRWAVQLELVPASEKINGLASVEALKRGKTRAREMPPVRPVEDSLVDAVLPRCSPPVAAMVRLQRLTGMRPGEVCMMRGVDLDLNADTSSTGEPPLWVYRPQRHKTEHHGLTREIWLGPREQEVLRPFLRTNLAAPIFSPADAMAWHKERRRAARKTPPGQGNSAGTNVCKKRRRSLRAAFSVMAYGRAITYACDAAFPLPEELAAILVPKRCGRGTKRETTEAWTERLTPEQRAKIKAWRKAHRFHPNQIRHARATELRRTHGLEAARVALGHTNVTTTQIYAERDANLAKSIARSAS
jgi:integrase